jgi:spore maturation protein A
MLNYIWAGLIIFSLVFALVADFGDIARDTYRNDQPFPVTLHFPEGYDAQARRQPVNVLIDQPTFQQFYGVETAPDSVYEATLLRVEEGMQVRFEQDAALPAPLTTIRDVTNPRTEQLLGILGPTTFDQFGTAANTYLIFEPVRFVKMNAIAGAALDFAETAATIALGLIGTLALFLGMLKIAEAAGVIYSLVKLVRPILRPLFPEVPADHPALGMIALNMAANIFGLGNAATPFGIRAMEELQKLNPTDDTATNPMVMMLAMNTASVQLVPPVLLLALMGLQINQLIFAIWITTGVSLFIAIVMAKLLSRTRRHRATDPNRQEPPPETPAAA